MELARRLRVKDHGILDRLGRPELVLYEQYGCDELVYLPRGARSCIRKLRGYDEQVQCAEVGGPVPANRRGAMTTCERLGGLCLLLQAE